MKISELMEESTTAPFEEEFTQPLYHGTELRRGEYSFKFRDRPKDTFLPIHNTLSAKSKQKFGINIRSLMFSSFDRSMAELFGTARILVPLGNDYRLFYSKGVTDMTTDIGAGLTKMRITINRMIDLRITDDKPTKSLTQAMRQEIDKCHQAFNGDLDDFFEHLITVAIHILDDLGHEYQKERLMVELNRFKDNLHDKIDYYLSNVHEIKSASDLNSVDSEEIMVYAPSGFRIKVPMVD